MFGVVGLGLVVGSVCTLISSFKFSSSFDLKKGFIAACKTLHLSVGDALPMINAQYAHAWGTRLLVGLPVGLPSAKVIDQKAAIAEALRLDADNVVMTYKNDGLVIDIITQPMPTNVKYEPSSGDYRVLIGVNNRGEKRYYDFNGPFPHLLVAGISGGGKSVMLRAILTSLISGPAPDFYLCDLKGGVELGIFRDLACVKGFATSLSDVLRVATEIEAEMYRRYEIMSHNGSQSWAGDKAIFVIDELADFKVRPKDPDVALKAAIKTKLTILSAKARAAGILIVFGTQRPSADIIDGVVKANIAASICFRTRDGVQSRIVLDHPGAADLPDIPGRMIFQTAYDETLQAPFLSADQARKLIADLPKRTKREEVVLNGVNHKPDTSEGVQMDRNFIEL